MANEQMQGMLSLMENLWGCLDALFVKLEKDEGWSTKHGDNWTLADVPYHLMYFDREVVALPLERGKDVPVAEQKVQRSIGELHAWNASEFAKRPADQTPWQSVEQWRTMKDRTRAAISTLQDGQLMEPVWIPLAGCGWVPAMASLGAGLSHSWSEFVQLKHLMGAEEPEPVAPAVHAALAFFQNFMPAFMNREAAKGANLNIVMDYTGTAGGSWTFRVYDGSCHLEEGAAENPDLVITQSPETGELVRQRKLDFATELQKGSIRVKGMEHLGTFGALFPEPDPDMTLEPMGAPTGV